MKYYKFCFPLGKSVPSDAISLKRDPTNPHDTNAIAVHISGIIAGHIDKQSAATIAPLLDRGFIWRVRPISAESVGKTSVPLKIVLTQNVVESAKPRPVAIAAPRPVTGKIAGIYRISVRGYHEVYIGQSRNVNERMHDHWRELNFQTHSNPLMCRLWMELGGSNFDADLVEAAPVGLDDHDLTLWLERREAYWIDHFDVRGGVMNFNAVKPVWVGEDRVRAQEERVQRQKNRALVEEKRRAIQVQIDAVWITKRPILERIAQEEKCIKSTEGFWGFLTSAEKKKRADQSRAIMPSLVAERNKLNDILEHLDNEMKNHPIPPSEGSRRLLRRSSSRRWMR